MVKSASCPGNGRVLKEQSSSDFDYLKFILTVARKNGWDLAALGLVPKDLPTSGLVMPSKKQLSDHNKLVKKVLQRFSKVLTPPVPLDLERSILSKAQTNWLPWEREVVEKAGGWRKEILRARPDILRELGAAVKATSAPRQD